jgi:hypothetical protein
LFSQKQWVVLVCLSAKDAERSQGDRAEQGRAKAEAVAQEVVSRTRKQLWSVCKDEEKE